MIVPPWASDPADPLLGELLRLCERTTSAGVLCCASAEGALCLWELAPEATDQPTLTFGDGRRIPGLEVAELSELEVNSESSPQVKGHPGPGPGPGNQPLATAGRIHETRPGPARRSVPIEVAVLGNVQVNGAPESFRYRRRLTELVAFLAMHPEGATTDAFASLLLPHQPARYRHPRPPAG